MGSNTKIFSLNEEANVIFVIVLSFLFSIVSVPLELSLYEKLLYECHLLF